MSGKNFYKKGQVSIGLLVMILFIASMVLYNAPNLSVLNKVAFATTGGGSMTGGGGGGSFIPECNDSVDNDNDGFIDWNGYGGKLKDSDCTDAGDTSERASTGGTVAGESALVVLQRVAGTSSATLAAGKTAGLTVETSNVVVAISALNNAGQLVANKAIALAAVKQLLLGLIQHTLVIVQERIAALLAQ